MCRNGSLYVKCSWRCLGHETHNVAVPVPQMCAALDEVEGQENGGIDARLTRLAAALDDRLEDMAATGDGVGAMGLVSGAGVDDLEGLVAFARSAAALQPDGTRLPARRCQASLLRISHSKRRHQFLTFGSLATVAGSELGSTQAHPARVCNHSRVRALSAA